jgi:chemotaxis signal transduction protein
LTARLAVPRLIPFATEVLERRARELATRAAEERGSVDRPHVAFRLRGQSCAVDADVVERAIARLVAPLSIPTTDGAERMVAFVDERPVPVVDLAGTAAATPRTAAQLEGHPAIVVAAAGGAVAVAVDGPLDLLEDHLAALAGGSSAPGEIRMSGVLGGGATALDPAWLREWVEKAARP